MVRIVIVPLLAALCVGAFSSAARAESLDGVYRGTIVCAKMNQGRDILRAPFDMTISGKTAMFARPVFNRIGTFVVGSELGTGTVEDNGTVKITSHWSAGGAGYEGSYSGSINAKTGTLTGTQVWKTQAGTEMRGCTVAFVGRS